MKKKGSVTRADKSEKTEEIRKKEKGVSKNEMKPKLPGKKICEEAKRERKKPKHLEIYCL